MKVKVKIWTTRIEDGDSLIDRRTTFNLIGVLNKHIEKNCLRGGEIFQSIEIEGFDFKE